MAELHNRLEELIYESDIDGLFEIVTLDDVVEAWCSYNSREHDYDSEETADDPDWWAVDLFMSSALSRVPEVHRALLVKLALHASDEALWTFAAGPLEDFVSDDPDDLAWLEEQCQDHERMRMALRGVWCASYVSEETLLRLDRMAGAELKRRLPREEWPQWLVAQHEAEQRLVALAGPSWHQVVIQEDVSEEIKTAALNYLRALEENHPERSFLIEECHLDPS